MHCVMPSQSHNRPLLTPHRRLLFFLLNWHPNEPSFFFFFYSLSLSLYIYRYINTKTYPLLKFKNKTKKRKLNRLIRFLFSQNGTSLFFLLLHGSGGASSEDGEEACGASPPIPTAGLQGGSYQLPGCCSEANCSSSVSGSSSSSHAASTAWSRRSVLTTSGFVRGGRGWLFLGTVLSQILII